MTRFFVLLAAVLAVALVGLGSAVFTVDRTEFVYLTQFGRPVATFDGKTDAGLHVKLPWPVQAVQRLDHRLRVFDLAGAELLTHDPQGQTIDKTLTIAAYVCWRIADTATDEASVARFLRTVGTPERAEAILGQQISSRLGAAIGGMRLDELIGVASGRAAEERMDRLSRRLLDQDSPDEDSPAARGGLRASALRSYGIELVDIRLRRFNYPAQVREAIFDRIRSERNKKVADYQSEGAQRAEAIKSQAEYEARTLLAEARASEQRLKGQAEADADRIRNQAQRQDPAFYAFLKKLAEYQRILGDNKTVLLLSSHRALFDLLFQPPQPEAPAVPPRPDTASLSSKPPAKPGGP